MSFAIKTIEIFCVLLLFNFIIQPALADQCVGFYGVNDTRVMPARPMANVVDSVSHDLFMAIQMNESLSISFDQAMKKLKFEVTSSNEQRIRSLINGLSKPDPTQGAIEQRVDVYFARYQELNTEVARLSALIKPENSKINDTALESLAIIKDLMNALKEDVTFFQTKENYLAILKNKLATEHSEFTKYSEENKLLFKSVGQIKEALWSQIHSGTFVNERLALMVSLLSAYEQKVISEQTQIDLAQHQVQNSGVQLEQLKQTIDMTQSLTAESLLVSRGLSPSRVNMLVTYYNDNFSSIKPYQMQLSAGQRLKNWKNTLFNGNRLANFKSKIKNVSIGAATSAAILTGPGWLLADVFFDYHDVDKFNARVQSASAQSKKEVPEQLVQGLMASENASQVGDSILGSLNNESIVFIAKYLPTENRFGSTSLKDLEVLTVIFNKQDKFARKFTNEEIRDLYQAMKDRKIISYKINMDKHTDIYYDEAFSALNGMILRAQKQ